MSQPNQDPETVDSTDSENAEILLADPEDYHQTQRLREIHEARRNVHKLLNEIDRFTKEKAHSKQKRHLADAVSAYVYELDPLMDQVDYEPNLPDEFPWESPEHFAIHMGAIVDGDSQRIAHYQESMLIFRECNKFLSEVKPLITEDDVEGGYLDL